MGKICCSIGLLVAFWISLIPGFALSQVVSPAPSTSTAQVSSSISRPEIGFSSKQKLIDHYQKHGKEFGKISREEYLRLAQDLRDRALDGNILEVKKPDGVVTRFDRKGGAFLAFNRDGVIRTFFRPNDGEAYFWRQARRIPNK
jgi:pyocin large subunit-like protein